MTQDALRYAGVPSANAEKVQVYYEYLQTRSHPGAEGMAFLSDLPAGLNTRLTKFLHAKDLSKVGAAQGPRAAPPPPSPTPRAVGRAMPLRIGAPLCLCNTRTSASSGHSAHCLPAGPMPPHRTCGPGGPLTRWLAARIARCALHRTRGHALSPRPRAACAAAAVQLDIFKDCERGFISALSARMRMINMAPKECIFKVGDAGKEMFVIKKVRTGGVLRCTRPGPARPMAAGYAEAARPASLARQYKAVQGWMATAHVVLALCAEWPVLLKAVQGSTRVQPLMLGQ